MKNSKINSTGKVKEGESAAVWVRRDTLVPWPGNPRKNAKAIAPVAQSIRKHGFGAVLLVRKETREVIAGHTRLLAAESLGMEFVPARFLDLDERQAHLLALADNRLGEIAEWDNDALARVLSSYSLDEVADAGWSGSELAELLGGDDDLSAIGDIADVSVEAQFQIVISGPLRRQADALDRLREHLDSDGEFTVNIQVH